MNNEIAVKERFAAMIIRDIPENSTFMETLRNVERLVEENS